ncbi:hypothetical protein OHQ88_13835 [Micromonospora zamorensis]|uniref:hypothetical protein n=1 Tax=Micromonospora zamorensis TaxID=709883 RepID=UPI002E22BD7E
MREVVHDPLGHPRAAVRDRGTVVDRAVHALRPAKPDGIQRAIYAALRDRRTISVYAKTTHEARPTFAAFWAGYTSEFRETQRGYGPVTAPLNLLDGLRIVDFVAAPPSSNSRRATSTAPTTIRPWSTRF